MISWASGGRDRNIRHRAIVTAHVGRRRSWSARARVVPLPLRRLDPPFHKTTPFAGGAPVRRREKQLGIKLRPHAHDLPPILGGAPFGFGAAVGVLASIVPHPPLLGGCGRCGGGRGTPGVKGPLEEIFYGIGDPRPILGFGTGELAPADHGIEVGVPDVDFYDVANTAPPPGPQAGLACCTMGGRGIPSGLGVRRRRRGAVRSAP